MSKWKDILCSWIERLNIVMMAILPRLIYRFNEISIKIPNTFFCRSGQLILKFLWNCKEPQVAILKVLKRTKLEYSHFLTSKLITKIQ